MLIKLLRLGIGMSLFKVNNIMYYIKGYYHKKTENIIENDPILASDYTVDNNYVTAGVIWKKVIRVAQIIFYVFTCAYFVGILWYIITNQVYLYHESIYKNMTVAQK